jgi:TatD DNase family protein
MKSRLYDTHCHLDFRDFEGDRAEVVRRAEAAGVVRIVVVGTDFASSRRAIALAEAHESVRAVVGWHPGHASEAPADIRPELRELARSPRVVAIGETGLDYFRLPEGKTNEIEAQREQLRERQRLLFKQQLEVATEVGLNVVVHQRASFDDTLRVFKPYADQVRAVFHCFANPVSELQAVLDLGSLVSFTGIVTFKNGEVVREAAAAVPADRFMVETDAPYLAPLPHRGKRCEPAYVRHTAEAVALARGCSVETVSELTCRTAEGFFREMW